MRNTPYLSFAYLLETQWDRDTYCRTDEKNCKEKQKFSFLPRRSYRVYNLRMSPQTAQPQLNTLLRLAFGQTPVWLNGPPDESVTVRWVTTNLSETHPGDLLLQPTSGGDFQAMELAYQAGAVCVLLLGDAPPQPLNCPDSLPVAWIRGRTELRFAQQTLLTVFINQRSALVEQGGRIHTRLSQLAAEGGGLVALVQGIAEISGRGVLVQDKRLQVLADCPSSTLSGIWQEVLAGIADPEFLPEELRDRKRAGRLAVKVTQELPGGLARLITPIVTGEIARGYLSLIGLTEDMDSLDYLVLEQGSLVCALEMARTKSVREAEKRLKGDLLTAILQENITPLDASLWIEAVGLEDGYAYSALRFAWRDTTAPSRRRLETIVNGEISHTELAVITSPLGAEVVCFCQSKAGGRPDAALQFAQAVVEQARQEYPQEAVLCGIGTPAKEVSAWRTSFRRAGQALEMARRLGENKPLYFPDLSVYRLLMQMEHHPELGAFLEETLGQLLAAENSSELIHTLEAYFAHHGNLSQAAEALYLHRNTLVYRMERIADITGLDLDNPDTRLAVQLALHIYRMTGSRR